MVARPMSNSSWPTSSGCSEDDEEVLRCSCCPAGRRHRGNGADPRTGAALGRAAAGTPTPAPSSPLDGEWRGTSDGGSCNAPLDYQLTIESGFVDGSAYDTTARGPVPNPNKSAPPPPTPGLWQIHGVAKAACTFNLLSVASVKGTDASAHAAHRAQRRPESGRQREQRLPPDGAAHPKLTSPSRSRRSQRPISSSATTVRPVARPIHRPRPPSPPWNASTTPSSRPMHQ